MKLLPANRGILYHRFMLNEDILRILKYQMQAEQGRNSSLFQGGCSWVKIFELGNHYRAEGATKILG